MFLRVAFFRHADDGCLAFGFDVLAFDGLFLVFFWVDDLRAPAFAKCLNVVSRDFLHHVGDFVFVWRASVFFDEFCYCVHMLYPSFLRSLTNLRNSSFAYQYLLPADGVSRFTHASMHLSTCCFSCVYSASSAGVSPCFAISASCFINPAWRAECYVLVDCARLRATFCACLILHYFLPFLEDFLWVGGRL